MAESTSVPSGWYPTAPPGPPPRPPSRRTPWVIAGVVALLVVVAIGVALAVKLTGNDAQHRPDGLLPMPFPTEPQREWTLQASDIAPGAAFGPIGLYSPEFRNYDGTLLVTVVDEGAGQPMSLAALDAADGTVLWTVPEVPFSVRSCATAAIDGLVPCIAADAGELRYYRISDGEVEHTEDLPGAAYVEVYRGSVYTAGRDADFQVGWMARGTVGDATSSWREEFDFGQCPGGDGSRFTVSEGIVTWIAGLHALAVTTDGVPLTPESRYDGGIAGQRRRGDRMPGSGRARRRFVANLDDRRLRRCHPA
ncbi:hypothetical protein [Antrihabitans sp. YC2-6]|uniref:hypothetical protein n=1 Tax=Antrihabitans sp. YC2-6 TaxID=2799498 RepID=UPI0018F41D3F|nr:hypothetical protein [Antrihabitans sp. YC2-6]MBJ8343221.1 hypothetical protein [Antrihabitans sp. YC2-6]